MNLFAFINVILSLESTNNWLKTKHLLMMIAFSHRLLMILRYFTLSKFVILHLFVLEFSFNFKRILLVPFL